MFKQNQCLVSILTSSVITISYIFLLDFLILKIYDLILVTNQIPYSLVFISFAMLLSCVAEGIAFVNGMRYILQNIEA